MQTSNLTDKLNTLRRILSDGPPLLIAYSGGVDSAFLLAFATRELPAGFATGILADSPSLPRAAKTRALETAASFGAKVLVIETAELSDPRYTRNAPDRCYFCKSELFARMEAEARRLGAARLAYGENADDAHTIRPGARAAAAFHVIAPLRDAGLRKAEIREASRAMGLPTADDPAQPCLSSRIAHGVPVTAETLRLVEQAEENIRALGFREFRVRHRIEDGLPAAVFCAGPNEQLTDQIRPQILAALLAAGYTRARIDPAGYQPPPRLDPAEAARALDSLIPRA